MAIDRRRLIGAGLAGAAVSLIPVAARAAAPGPACAACLRRADGRFAVAILDADGAILAQEILPGRGHGIAVSPDRRSVVAFARRPGRFAVALDVPRGVFRTAFTAGKGRHFYGHGVFSPDGRLLYAPENDYDGGRGAIGVYDVAAGFLRVDELPGGGIGPHEAVLLRDGTTLAVAVGGIATHPDSGRRKLNLATMAPALAYLDRRSGNILESVALPAEWRKLSLRHLAADATDTVWIGGQYEGSATDTPPLVWRRRRGGSLQVAAAPDGLFTAMQHYVGSVAASRDGSRVVATSPRGGVAAVWATAGGAPVAVHRIADVCGAAAGPDGGVLMSDGRGRVYRNGKTLSVRQGIAWDNHMAAI